MNFSSTSLLARIVLFSNNSIPTLFFKSLSGALKSLTILLVDFSIEATVEHPVIETKHSSKNNIPTTG
jgi:hypothetical protein